MLCEWQKSKCWAKVTLPCNSAFGKVADRCRIADFFKYYGTTNPSWILKKKISISRVAQGLNITREWPGSLKSLHSSQPGIGPRCAWHKLSMAQCKIPVGVDNASTKHHDLSLTLQNVNERYSDHYDMSRFSTQVEMQNIANRFTI